MIANRAAPAEMTISPVDGTVEMGGRVSPVGMMFTDRGIYKLGETIHAKALFRMREQKGTSSLKGEEVKLSAEDWADYQRAFDPASPHDLLSRPDFYALELTAVASGLRPA